MFWNPEIWGNKKSVKDTIADFSLDFVCIRETKREDFLDSWLNVIVADNFYLALRTSKGASCGLLMGVRDGSMMLLLVLQTKKFTSIVLMDRQTALSGTS
jgi:hypothetical protein